MTCRGAIVLCALACSASLLAQQQAPLRFRSGVERVRLDVLAHHNGRPLADLVPEDFVVTDNGRPVKNLELTTNDDAVAVTVLLDLSRSIAVDAMEEMVTASEELVEVLEPRDTAWLLTFDDHIALRAGPVSQREVLRRALSSLRPGGGTAMWDALFGGIGLLSRHGGRALALVFSDGVDTTSWIDEPRMLETLQRADVVVSAIRPRHMADGFMPLERAAIATGGVVLKTERGAKLDKQFANLLNEFRQGYVLSYSAADLPGDEKGWHDVEIKLSWRKGKVRVRPGYFDPGR
jgi:Ca-activated chloride channel family protein